MKVCGKCKSNKYESEFCKNKNTVDGLSWQCKSCVKIYNRSKLGIVSTGFRSQICQSKAQNYPLPNYTKQEFIDWVNAQPRFDDLYSAWVQSNYTKALTPTISRKNVYRSFTLDNLELSFFHTYNKKLGETRVNGINTKHAKAVNQLSKDGILLRTFYSVREAGRQLGINHTSIALCCLKRKKYITAGGFKWQYA